MITHQIITVEIARLAYGFMKAKMRRLPWDQAEKRLGEIETKL